MIALNLNALYDFLKQNKEDVKKQEATDQIYIIYKQEGLEFPLFIKTDGTVLQMIIFLPCKLKPNTAPDMGRLLHLLNKEIDLPGFGMDEQSGITFYRNVITTNKKLDTEVFLDILNAMPRLAQMFFPLISRVANGTSYESVANKLVDTMRKLAEQPETN